MNEVLQRPRWQNSGTEARKDQHLAHAMLRVHPEAYVASQRLCWVCKDCICSRSFSQDAGISQQSPSDSFTDEQLMYPRARAARCNPGVPDAFLWEEAVLQELLLWH